MYGVTNVEIFGIGVENYDYGIASNQISIIYILLIIYKLALADMYLSEQLVQNQEGKYLGTCEYGCEKIVLETLHSTRIHNALLLY